MNRSALIEQPPIVVTPCMIKAYGATAAIFIQQIWYWQQMNINIKDGSSWVYNTSEAWGEQIGLSSRTIKTLTTKLRNAGVIETTSEYNKMKIDKTLWFHLNVDKVRKDTAKLLESYVVKHLPNGSEESSQPIPETTTETTINSTNVELAKPNNKKVEIDRMLALWEEEIGYPINGKVQKNRYAINNLLKKHGEDGLTRLVAGVKLAMDDQYAPRIADFTELQYKLNTLLAWGNKRERVPTEDNVVTIG